MESGPGPLFRLVTVLVVIGIHVLALTPRGTLLAPLLGAHARTVAFRNAQRRLPLPLPTPRI